MGNVVAYSDLLSRRSRVGTVEEECLSTFAMIADAIERIDVQAATDLTLFCLEQECKSVYDIMRQWQDDLRSLASACGMSDEDIAGTEERLMGLLRLPDGRPYDHETGWQVVRAAFAVLLARLGERQWAEASVSVASACESWRVVHDREIDCTYGMMSEFVARFGEASVPEMFEAIGRPHFEEFVALGDPTERSWTSEGREAVLRDALEAMRVHLSTIDRDGAPIELREHDDRWVMEFDPCGSGGRATRGDRIEGTPSRLDPPYNFGVIQGAYDWTDGKHGVCIYCNHCQQVYEQWPIDRAGWPFYVVEPPLYPDGDRSAPDRQRCQYTIYKDPSFVPDDVYRRCGRTPPAREADVPPIVSSTDERE